MKNVRTRETTIYLLIFTFLTFGSVLSEPKGFQTAADGDVDLEFHTEVTPDYETYLLGKEETLKAGIAAGGPQEQNRMALVLVKLGQIHVETDRAYERLDVVAGDLEVQMEEVEDLVMNELLDHVTEDIANVLNGLRDLFLGSRYKDLKSRVEGIGNGVEADVEEVESVWSDYLDTVEANLDVIRDHLDVLKTTEGQFTVRFHVLGRDFDQDDVFEVNRANIDDVVALEDAFRTASDEAQNAGDLLRAILEGNSRNNPGAIVAYQVALRQVHVALDTLRTALDAEPLSTAGEVLTVIEDVREHIHDLQDMVSEAEDLMAGKIYDLDEVLVRPVALIENLNDHPEDIFLDFYRSQSPESYTFHGLFPQGLSDDLLDIMSADMVINPTASWEQMDTHAQTLEQEFRSRLAATPWDGEANAGMAIVQTFFLISDNHQNVEDTVEMLQEGDLAGIAQQFDVEDFDYRDSLEDIRPYLEAARQDPDAVFIILAKLDEDPDDPFGVHTGDRIWPVPLTGELLGQVLDISEALNQSGTDLAETVGDLLNEAEESFEMDLDPNLLDFTDVESGLDFALSLQRSNERFLAITPTGVDRMVDAGEEIRGQLADLSDAVSALVDLVDAVHKRDGDLPVDTGQLVDFVDDFDARYREVQADFKPSGNTTRIGGEAINLSAWFDVPPDSLLHRLIWFLDDDDATDNTLGGLFPGGEPPTQSGGGPVGPVALDLDLAIGDQEQRRTTAPLEVGDRVTIDLVVTERAAEAVGFEVALEFNDIHLAFIAYTPSDVFDGAIPITKPETGRVKITAAVTGGTSLKDSGSMGQVTFEVLGGFTARTTVTLVSAQLGYPSGPQQLEIGSGGATVYFGGAPSPDFNGNGTVGFEDFIAFAQVYGLSEGDDRYHSRYDLSQNGSIGFEDFIQFAQAYGKPVG